MKPLIVLYYHRILPFKGYDVDLETFEWQLSFLKKHFDIVPPEILYDLRNGFKLKKTSVLLTFDDGFLDNYVYAYPMLKSFGFRALLFVITSKIVQRKPTKTMEQSKNNLFVPKREETGLYDSLNGDNSEFISWDELKILNDSGVFAIGSHSHNHVKVFVDDTVRDIWVDSSSAHWSYEYALGEKPTIGAPIFSMKSALAGRRFYPSREFVEKVKNFYLKYKDKNRAIEEASKIKNKGYFESKEDYLRRVKEDLSGSKRLLKEKLGIDTSFLSWPWGEFSNESIEAAKEVGFEFCFTTQKKAFFGGDFCMIGRIKAPQEKARFKRKLVSNSSYLFAKAYALWHS